MGKAWPVLSLVAKWLLIPLGLFGVGYYFIAPQIGRTTAPAGKPSISKPAPDPGTADPTPDSTDESTAASKHYKGPDVEVTVARGSRIRPTRRYRDRTTGRYSTSSTDNGIYHNGKVRKHRKRKPKSDTTAPSDGGAGATDAGGSAGGTGGGNGLLLSHANLKNA